MTTTTSATSASSAATTPTTSTSATAATASATQQVLTALNAGSGIDTGSLVSSLVAAQFANQTDALTKQGTTLTTELSATSTLMSGITGFASALSSLVKSGSLTTQPTVSNASVLAATALPGAKLAGLSSSVEVRQLATAQSATTVVPGDRSAHVGTGTLTFAFASGSSKTVTIGDDDATLDGIATAINAAAVGVTASIVTDVDGTARLTMKGATGSANAFTVSAAEADGDPGLSVLEVGDGKTGTTINVAAQNAVVRVDGVEVQRASNTVNDLIAGVSLSLTSAAPGSPVTLGSTTPTSNLSQAVSNFVDTYNQVFGTVKSETDPITGDLRSDSAAQTLLRQMKGLTLAPLVTGAATGTPTTLAEIGVATNRDGTLSVDTDTLTAALAKWPQSVEAMFASGSGATGNGIMGALQAVSDAATDKTIGLTASQATYTKAQGDLADAQADLATRRSDMSTRLTQQFAAMDSKVTAYKSTQSFLEQQVDAWNKKDS